MSIITVKGKISIEDAGIILSHEHILWDLTPLISKEGKKSYFDKITKSNRHLVDNNPYALYDNAFMLSEEIILNELLLFKKAGGNTIVEVTTSQFGRNPVALARLSELSGVNIVMGCGNYVARSMTENEKMMSVDEMAKLWINEIKFGVEGGIKPGIIGEIGTDTVITEAEWKSVKAAAIASKETGLSIHIHAALYNTNGLDIAKSLLDDKVAPNKICINHIDVDINSDYILKLLELGVYVEFDNVGKEFQGDSSSTLVGRFNTDLERAVEIKKLVDKGYADQIMITNDICLKSMLENYGGKGYSHAISGFKQMLSEKGVADSALEKIFIHNPQQFLDVKENK